MKVPNCYSVEGMREVLRPIQANIERAQFSVDDRATIPLQLVTAELVLALHHSGNLDYYAAE